MAISLNKLASALKEVNAVKNAKKNSKKTKATGTERKQRAIEDMPNTIKVGNFTTETGISSYMKAGGIELRKELSNKWGVFQLIKEPKTGGKTVRYDYMFAFLVPTEDTLNKIDELEKIRLKKDDLMVTMKKVKGEGTFTYKRMPSIVKIKAVASKENDVRTLLKKTSKVSNKVPTIRFNTSGVASITKDVVKYLSIIDETLLTKKGATFHNIIKTGTIELPTVCGKKVVNSRGLDFYGGDINKAIVAIKPTTSNALKKATEARNKRTIELLTSNKTIDQTVDVYENCTYTYYVLGILNSETDTNEVESTDSTEDLVAALASEAKQSVPNSAYFEEVETEDIKEDGEGEETDFSFDADEDEEEEDSIFGR